MDIISEALNTYALKSGPVPSKFIVIASVEAFTAKSTPPIQQELVDGIHSFPPSVLTLEVVKDKVAVLPPDVPDVVQLYAVAVDEELEDDEVPPPPHATKNVTKVRANIIFITKRDHSFKQK